MFSWKDFFSSSFTVLQTEKVWTYNIPVNKTSSTIEAALVNEADALFEILYSEKKKKKKVKKKWQKGQSSGWQTDSF